LYENASILDSCFKQEKTLQERDHLGDPNVKERIKI
jgi:hypothetical protein